MKTRRTFVRTMTCGLVALAVMVVPAIAAELLGTVKSVDVEGKKIVVVEKGTDNEVTVTLTDETTIETPKGKSIMLRGLAKAVEKNPGKVRVAVTHENAVASKIVMKGAAKKKEAP